VSTVPVETKSASHTHEKDRKEGISYAKEKTLVVAGEENTKADCNVKGICTSNTPYDPGAVASQNTTEHIYGDTAWWEDHHVVEIIHAKSNIGGDYRFLPKGGNSDNERVTV
jgi:hypothetical protein